MHKERLCFMLFLLVVFFIWQLLNNVNQTGIQQLLKNNGCPDTHIVTVEHGGRLGNTIWEYLSLLAIVHLCEKDFPLTPYIPNKLKDSIKTLFEKIDVAELSELSSECQELYSSAYLPFTKPFDKNAIFNMKNKVFLTLGVYSARYEDMIQYGLEKIKGELRFSLFYRTFSYKILNDIKTKFNISDDNITYVGMHYRGTDYVNYLEKDYKKSYADLPDYKYYRKAMDYFTSRFHNVIFILITIDSDWLSKNQENLLKHDNLVINPIIRSDPLKDLALLSFCNHSIITYGTYGATAAIYANGTTIAYDVKIPLDYAGPTLPSGIAKLLPNWHLIS